MKKVYFDQTEVKGCVGIFSSCAEVIPAGTAMNAMPVKYRNETYKQLEEEMGIRFLYKDAVPEVPFFTVPYLEIVAMDDSCGFLGTLQDESIIYIDAGRNCFLVAESPDALLEMKARWRSLMSSTDKIIAYDSKESAMAELEFVDIKDIVK